MAIELGDCCYVRPDADWTAIDVLIIESVESDKITLLSVQRNGNYSGARLTLPRNTALFKSPYQLSAWPDNPEALAIHREARRIRSSAVHWIAESKGRPKLRQLLEHLETTFGTEHRPFVRGCLKCSIGVGAIIVRGKAGSSPDELSVSVSKSSHEREHTAAYAAGFADELETQAKRVGLLIRHWPTVGTFREELLRNLLQKHLPERYHVATGFLLGYPRQLDILIYDRIDHAPFFREGNLVVVDASAIRAIIEVKSTLTNKELRSALEILHNIDKRVGPPIFKGVFAYTSKMSTAAILDTMVDFYKLDNEHIESHAALMSLTQIVTAVCVQRHTLVLSDFHEIDDEHGGMIVPSLFSVENVLGRSPQAAIFFDTLKRYARGAGAATGVELAWFIEAELDRGEERDVYDEIWGPYFARMTDDDYDGAEVRAEAEVIKRWRRGESWSDPKARSDGPK